MKKATKVKKKVLKKLKKLKKKEKAKSKKEVLQMRKLIATNYKTQLDIFKAILLNLSTTNNFYPYLIESTFFFPHNFGGCYTSCSSNRSPNKKISFKIVNLEIWLLNQNKNIQKTKNIYISLSFNGVDLAKK